jgi:hypothetical protein
VRILPIVSLLGLLACFATSFVLPPIQPGSQWEAQAGTDLAAVAPAGPGAPEVRQDYDKATGFTRYFVNTHPGAHAAWVEKPQITFFALVRGQQAPLHPPQWIGLVFRTFEPEAVTGVRLFLRCGALTDSIGVSAGSYVAQTSSTHSHFLTYMIPVASVARFAACGEGEMEIGQVRAPFIQPQLGGIRALLLRLGAASTGS